MTLHLLDQLFDLSKNLRLIAQQTSASTTPNKRLTNSRWKEQVRTANYLPEGYVFYERATGDRFFSFELGTDLAILTPPQ